VTALALAAVLAAGGAACKREQKAAPEPAPAPTPAKGIAPLPPPLAASAFYRIDAGPQTPCTAGAVCEARLVLTALGAYHVNQKYPFKLLAEPGPDLTVDGTGTFALDDARTGTLTVKFRAAKPGTVRLAGTFKLSVCTEEECEIVEPKVQLELPVG